MPHGVVHPRGFAACGCAAWGSRVWLSRVWLQRVVAQRVVVQRVVAACGCPACGCPACGCPACGCCVWLSSVWLLDQSVQRKRCEKLLFTPFFFVLGDIYRASNGYILPVLWKISFLAFQSHL